MILVNAYLLELLQCLPLVGALLLFRVRHHGLAWVIGLSFGLVEFGLVIWLYRLFDIHSDAWQWSHRFPVTSVLVYAVGVDGVTVLFMLLTAFLSLLLAIYGGVVRRFKPLSRFLAVILVSEATLMSQFVTVDLLWFTVMSAIHTVLIGYLFTTWAVSSEEWLAVHRYYQFMGTSLLLLLAATLMLGWNHADVTGDHWRFELSALMNDDRSPYLQGVIFCLLFYGLAIRLPLFPFHGWLPLVMEHGTVATAMALLVGIKSGIYGMVRYLLVLLPDAVWQLHGYLIAMAGIGIFYSALLALIQQNLRKLFAYAVISHTGILVIGLFSLHPDAFQGSIILTITFGVAITTLLLMTGIVYLRTNTMVLSRLGGLFYPLPLVGIAFLIASLSIVGMPGTPGFDAVHLMLEAAIERFGALVTVTAALGNVAAAACLLLAFQRAFLAMPVSKGAGEVKIARGTFFEIGLAVALIGLQLTSGFYVDPWLDLIEKTTQKLAAPYARGWDQ